MRIYLSADAGRLRLLREGGTITGQARVPDSDDEADEFDAMLSAALPGAAVVAADVETAQQPVDLASIAALHVDADSSGDLAWFAPQEIDQVIDLLEP